MQKNKSIVVGVDASRNRSGGAQAHLIGILSEMDPSDYGISHVHVWSFRSLLDRLPNKSWLIKHDSNPKNSTLLGQLWWQATKLSNELKNAGCDILFATDASTLCRFKPVVVLSQDLLSYESEVMRTFGFGFARFRLLAILFLQNRAFRNSDGAIFLTNYAANIIQESCGQLTSYICIPHGVDCSFTKNNKLTSWPFDKRRDIRCIYVSNAEMYKYQWSVVDAIAILRNRGHNVTLTLVGSGSGRAQVLLEDTITRVDPMREFVKQLEFIPKNDLLNKLLESDIFIFASACEAFGITLLEGMSLGLPIACSNRSSLPETLKDGGIYFDPTDPNSIANAVESIIESDNRRAFISSHAKSLSQQFSWKRCANETWDYVVSTYHGISS